VSGIRTSISKEKATIANIRSTYSKEKRRADRTHVWLFYIIRRISFYPTWLFLKLGVSANQATYLSMIIGAIGCGFLAMGEYTIRITGALLVSSWIVLDCVDGNIARYRKTFSQYGEFIDALSGYMMNAFLFLSVGIGASVHLEPSFLIIAQTFDVNPNLLILLGAWGSLMAVFPRLVYHKFLTTFPQGRNADIKSEEESVGGFYHVIHRIAQNIVEFSGFLTPILLLATIFRFLSIFVFFYALMNTGVLIITTGRIILKGRRLSEGVDKL